VETAGLFPDAPTHIRDCFYDRSMVGEARPGYELWRPNRAKSSSLTTRFVVALLQIVSAALIAIIVLGGWSVLNGAGLWGIITLVIGFLYVLLAIMTWRWSRGALTLTVALTVFMLIFSTIGFESWFARDRAGFTEPALPSDLLGLLTVIMIPVQIALGIAASIAFRQEWHVEEERPIGSGETPAQGGTAASGPASPTPA
jgi:hypothetical protein